MKEQELFGWDWSHLVDAFDSALSYFPIIELALGGERLGWVKD